MNKTILYASLVGLLATAANAAQIAWQPVQNIAGASDVSTAGTYFGSWAPANVSLAVNGVTFQANDLPSFTIDSWFQGNYNGFGSPNTSDANYNTLLSSAHFSSDGTGGSFSWDGLTVGHTYQVQLWTEDTRNIGKRRWENIYEVNYGDSGTSGALNFPADGTSPVGQFDLGTFVADASTQRIAFETWCNVGGGQCAQVNLFQVRDLTDVPEPSSLALLLAGGLGLLRSFRRQGRA
jgi:hypothetical protein